MLEAEENYRAIFENTGTATVIIEESMTISLVNREFEKLSGYMKEEIEGKKSWTEFVMGGDLDRMKEYHNVRRDSPEAAPKRYDLRFIDRHGAIKNVIASVDIIPQTKRSVASLLDVTARIKAEEALKESEARLKDLFDNASDLIQLIDKNGNYSYVNRKWCELLGFREDEAKLLHFTDIVRKDQIPHCNDAFIKVANGEIIQQMETVYVSKDGREIYVEGNMSPLHKDGQFVSCRGIFRDITDRKMLKEQLDRITMELSISLSEVFEALKKISSGDPDVRVSEKSEIEIISKLKHMINVTAENIGEIVDQSHEFAMVLAEHFEVLHKVSTGDYSARVSGESKVELLEAFKKVTNEMIGSIHKTITESELTGELLKESEKRYRDLSEFLPQVVFELDKEGNVIFINRQAFDLFGYTRDEFKKGINIVDIFIPEDRERAVQNMRSRLKGEKLGGIEYRVRKKDGGIFPVVAFASPIFRKSELMGLRGILIDITERKRMEEELKRLSVTDNLTQTYNRTKFEEVIKREIKRTKRNGRPLSVALFDIDHFKEVNDAYGHDVGDSVLKTLSQIAKSNMRDIDYLIRWGGEEFILIALDTDLKGAAVIAEKIRHAIESHGFYKVGRVTASFGVTQFKQDDTEDSFVKRADETLYKAKERGRNRVEASV